MHSTLIYLCQFIQTINNELDPEIFNLLKINFIIKYDNDTITASFEEWMFASEFLWIFVFLVNYSTLRSTLVKKDLWTVIKNKSSSSLCHAPLKPDLFFPADLGFPGLWGVPSQASWLHADPGLPTDQHQPGPACPLWTGQPGAASGAGAGTG